MSQDQSAHRAAMRDTFLRVMPVVAGENDDPGDLDEEAASAELLRHVQEAVRAIIDAYLDFAGEECDVERARALCAVIDRFAPHLDDDPRWIGGVLDPVLVDSRWALGLEPRLNLAVLTSNTRQVWLRARRVAAGERRPKAARDAMKSGDAARAVAELSGYVADFPDDPNAWFDLGNARSALDDAEGGVAACRRAIALGSLPHAHYNLGLLLMRKARFDEALGEFRATRSAMPEYAEAWHNEGLMLRELGRAAEARDRFSDARAAYEARLQDDPENAASIMWMAAVTSALGDMALAADLLSKALTLRPALREEAASDPDLAGLLS